MKEKILIINKEAFGRITDAYKWCEYLRNDYDITFLCIDDPDGKRRFLESVKIKYVYSPANRTVRGIFFLLACLWNIFWFRGKIFVVYFEPCHLFKKILPWKKMHLDIRTLSVTNNNNENIRYNSLLCKTCDLYDSVSVISEGVLSQMQLQNRNVYILPLGADVISIKPKNYAVLNLLYVGALDNRNISITIDGLNLFLSKYPKISVRYDIVGSGSYEYDRIKSLITNYNLESIVYCHGYIPYDQLAVFFDNSSYGVSFVPLTDYYDKQPVTKTYEYILSGLYTIATSTSGNQKVISNDNGVLINDTAESFASALEFIHTHQMNICESKIRNSLLDCTWKNIVINKMMNVLANI